MNIVDFLKPELMILIPTCWGIGLVCKESSMNNQNIPAVLALTSILLSLLWILSDGKAAYNLPMAIFTAITQGIVLWLAAWQSYDKGIKTLGGDAEEQGGT